MQACQKPSRRILPVWYGELLTADLFLIFAGTFLSSYLPGEALLLGGLVLGGVSLLLAGWVIPARYRKLSYRLDEEGIAQTGGLFYTRRVYMPFSSVREISLWADPFRQMAGIAKLELHSAGGCFRLDGLSQEDCREILIRIKGKEEKREPF